MGAWIAIVLSGVVAVMLFIGLIGSMFSGEEMEVPKDAALIIPLEGELIERENATDISLQNMLYGSAEKVQTVETLVAAIKEAAGNKDIKCIYLDCRGISAAPASLHAVRRELQEFKKSKKKIFAYADNFSQGDYYLASAADEIALNPSGMLAMQGLGGVSMYFKGLLDKLGVEVQAVRVGEGKSAIEPFTATEMSETARTQNMVLFDTIWAGIRADMASGRPGVTAAAIDTLISRDLVMTRPASFVLQKKLVNSLEYRHVFEDKVAKYCGQKEGELCGVSPGLLAAKAGLPGALKGSGAEFSFKAGSGASSVSPEGNQVAVLYAVGGIDDATGFGAEGINSEKLVPEILELAKNDNVKALVLRVNSPGGSAFGSEQIWEALETFKKTGKPFVVSMGDYAASGGYYISCGANRIFADPYTITGSIGIFGLIPNFYGLMQKIGVNPQLVATNPSAQFANGFFPMDPTQLAAMQAMVEDGYNLFVKRCADGRHCTVDKIKQIADGRPLAATMAKNYGLVDELGSLEQAVAYAAKKAKLKNYNTVSYPNGGNMMEALMENLEQPGMSVLLMNPSPEVMQKMALRLAESWTGRGALQARAPRIIFSY